MLTELGTQRDAGYSMVTPASASSVVTSASSQAVAVVNGDPMAFDALVDCCWDEDEEEDEEASQTSLGSSTTSKKTSRKTRTPRQTLKSVSFIKSFLLFMSHLLLPTLSMI